MGKEKNGKDIKKDSMPIPLKKREEVLMPPSKTTKKKRTWFSYKTQKGAERNTHGPSHFIEKQFFIAFPLPKHINF